MSNAVAEALRPRSQDPVDVLRDEIAAHFVPANAYERVLANNYASAIARCDTAYQMEKNAFAKTNPLEMLEKFPERFKALTRYVADCERGVRRAVEELRRAIRERKKAVVHPPATHPVAHPAPRPQAPVPAEPPSAARPANRRE